MVRMLGIALMCSITSGCVATTKVIVKHQFPDEHIQYEITKEWTREYQEKIMNFPYGSKIEFNGAALTFTKIENTKSGGVVCLFQDSAGKTIKLTQQDVEKALSL